MWTNQVTLNTLKYIWTNKVILLTYNTHELSNTNINNNFMALWAYNKNIKPNPNSH